jgi:hypothetical protein
MRVPRPIHDALAAVPTTDDGELGIAVVEDVPAGDRWFPLEALTGDGQRLNDAVDRVATGWLTERRDIAGGALLTDVAFALLLRSAVTVLAVRRAPGLRVSEVAVRLHDDGWVDLVALGPRFACLPDDPMAGHEQAVVVADDEALLRWVLADYESLLSPLVDQVHARYRRPRTALWRHGGDALAEAFLWAGEVLADRQAAWEVGPRAVALAPERLGTHADYRIWRSGAVEQPGRVRAQCCLHYRTEAARYCFSCPLRDDDHRLGRLAEREPVE